MSKRRCVLLTLVTFVELLSSRETRCRSTAAPPGGRFVRAEGVEIFVQELGPSEGPAVLFVHGTGAWSELWRETLTFMAGEGFRAIAIDVPPFGYSEKPRGARAYQRSREAQRLEAVLDALDLPQAAVVAHSVGSRGAVELALRVPHRVRSLVLIDPALGFGAHVDGEAPHFEQNHPSWVQQAFFAASPARDGVLGATATNPRLTRTLFRRFVFREEAITPERVAVLQQPLQVQGTTRAYGDWLRNLMASKDDSSSSRLDHLSTLSMPVHLIWGEADTITPLWQGRALQEVIPGSTLDIIPGSGHIPYLEAPDEFQHSLITRLSAP